MNYEGRQEEFCNICSMPMVFNRTDPVNEKVGYWECHNSRCVKQTGAADSGTRKEFASGALRDRPGGKGMYVLLSPVGLRRIAQRCEQGHIKYGDGRNWEKGMPISEFIDSAMRHIAQYLDGDTSEDHLAAAAWNLQAAMHTEEKLPHMQDIPARLALNGEVNPDHNP